ncbi:FecR family protein [Thalassolituus hydrocarboniclasticus]|uniref:FecR domain-containing protein n=1 Tax=Thalassolituus hydrocarboniclasticus TaxID=2742796 RepID=A0ABY6A6A0_9GAMM|nr:FecR family protein [Thalassolituus hydrocarboniclasticus]UXD86178.1 FecR domain-containing protein [Thalassolituus hydrocarboniclasticus]
MKSLFFALCMLLILPVQAENIGIISVSVGQVSWHRGGEAIQLQRGDAVEQGDKVSTGSKARLVLKMNEGSVITLGADTSVQLSEWQYAAGSDSNSARLEFVEGAFRFITGLITRQTDPQLTVTTPAATIGIRGTDFWGGYLQPDVLDVIMLEGEHKLEIRNDAGVVFIEEPGFGVSVVAGEPPRQPLKWGEEKVRRAVESISLP